MAIIAARCALQMESPGEPAQMRVPLEKGRDNEPFSFGPLRFEPVNLFVQDRPWDDFSPHVRVEYRVSTPSTEPEHSYLYYYDGTQEQVTGNVPLAMDNVLVDLETGPDDNVAVVISRLEPGNEFHVGLGKKVFFDTFAIHFEEMLTGWSALPDGGMVNDRRVYRLILSEDGREEKFCVPPLSQYGQGTCDIEWNGWLVSVTGTHEKHLKVVCNRTGAD